MEEVKKAPSSIDILSLNCWGLKYLAKFRQERLREIGRQLALHDPPLQIVGLQELWTQEDYHSVREQTRHLLPFGKFYYSGIFGGGLVILSKWPIEESSMFRYPLNGRPTAFFRGDWFVGKGVACAKIRIGPSRQDLVEVFCTHLHAPYEQEPNDSYLCHRTAQAWEIAKLMKGAAERGHLVVGLGDFNMVPLSFAHRLVTSHAPVVDIWRELHPDSSLGAAGCNAERQQNALQPTADLNLLENGTTCDSVLNTWRWSKERSQQLKKGIDVKVSGSEEDPRAKRLDYIFVGTNVQHPLGSASRPTWHAEYAKVVMTERHPQLKCSLSDHFAIYTRISHKDTSNEKATDSERNEAGQQSSIVEVKNEDRLRSSTEPELEASAASIYSEILNMISKYMTRERRQRRLRLYHFLVSCVVSIGCFVAIWWSPKNYVSFTLLLVSTLGLGAGIIDGLIGGLFVGSELRALKEFEWEIKNAEQLVGVGKREEIALREWYD